MRKAFGRAIVKLGEIHPELVLLNGDVEQEMHEFRHRWPQRIINIGICEQSMISVAAGMATQGLRPVVYSITPFVLERPFEQIKIDVDSQALPVVLIGYSDYPTSGPTHTPLNPRLLCQCFTNLRAFFPATAEEAYQDIMVAVGCGHPAFVSLKRAPK
jgi:transketolase